MDRPNDSQGAAGIRPDVMPRTRVTAPSCGGRMPITVRSEDPNQERPAAEGSNAATTDSQELPSTRVFAATLDEVKQTKMILTAKGLPWEIVNMIMDKAEYWASTKASVDYSRLPLKRFAIRGSSPGENTFLLRSDPIGLTKWTAPAEKSPAFRNWSEAAKPKVVDDSCYDGSGDGEAQEPGVSNTGGEAPIRASKPMVTAEQVDFPKSDMEKLADIPVPTLENPVRKIVFDIVSGDQGHAPPSRTIRKRALYDESCTWFDAGLDRFDRTRQCPTNCLDRNRPEFASDGIQPCMIRPVWPPSQVVSEQNNNDSDDESDEGHSSTRVDDDKKRQEEPDDGNTKTYAYVHVLLPNPRHVIQMNRRADRALRHHHVEWSWLDDGITGNEDMGFAGHPPSGNGDFVRSLRLGDMITVWGRARYPGWYNNVQKVDMRIYYAI